MGLTLKPSELHRFATLTELKVSPKDVGRLYARAEMLAKLPRTVQRWIVQKASAQADPYMGFVVEPYCFFLALSTGLCLPPYQQLVWKVVFLQNSIINQAYDFIQGPR